MKKSRKHPRHDRKFAFRLTEAEYELITGNAEGARMSVSEYVRRILKGRNPAYRYEIPINDPEILNIFANLETVTQDLNEIAVKLNSGTKWDRELHLKVKDDLKEIYRMKEALNEYSHGETLRDRVLEELNKLNLNRQDY